MRRSTPNTQNKTPALNDVARPMPFQELIKTVMQCHETESRFVHTKSYVNGVASGLE